MLQEHVVCRIAEEGGVLECQVIVLGSRRLHGIARLSGGGVRERVPRLSSLPVLVAQTGETNGIFSPARLRPDMGFPEGARG